MYIQDTFTILAWCYIKLQNMMEIFDPFHLIFRFKILEQFENGLDQCITSIINQITYK